MLRETFERAGGRRPTELRGAYDDRLAETIEGVGQEGVRSATSADRETVRALCAGESPELSLETAAEILALDGELPDATSIAAEARDILLAGMSTAVLDAETVVSGLDDALGPSELQQKVTGQAPMTLDEYALVQSYVDQHSP